MPNHMTLQWTTTPVTPYMRTRAPSILSMLMLASLFAAAPAQATILTFDIGTDSNGAAIPIGYGNNVDQAVVSGITYLEGNGWTRDITVDFVPDSNPFPFNHWATGYAQTPQGVTLLPHALGHSHFNVPGEIVFTPAAGHSVQLLAFDIGTWFSAYLTDIRVWDGDGTRAAPNLFSFNGTLGQGIVYSPLTGAVSSNDVLHLYISNLGSTGIDNIHFTQDAVPLPAAVWLFASAMAGVALLGRRRTSMTSRR